jgi:hypothetical protein
MKLPVFPGEGPVNGKDSNNRGRRRPFKKEGRVPDNRPGPEKQGQGFGPGQNSRQNRNSNVKGEFWKHKRGEKSPGTASKYNKNGELYDRPRWTAPSLNTDPLPSPNCIRCGQPISDLHAALTDKRTGEPIHFDCVIAELAEHEILETGDLISYIGGGRFGIVHFANPDSRREAGNFTIKKIIEWENKENRAEWRGVIADHYSIT